MSVVTYSKNASLTMGKKHDSKTVGQSTGWNALNITNSNGVMTAAVGKSRRGEDTCRRFGGVDKFEELAFRTHAKMVRHPSLMGYFPDTIDMEPITIKNARFMAGYFGGPEYGGPGIADAHSFLRLTHEQYDDFLKIFEEEIHAMNCSDKDAVDKIIRGMESLRDVIVDKKVVRKKPPKKSVAKKAAAKPNAAKKNSSILPAESVEPENEKDKLKPDVEEAKDALLKNFKCPYLSMFPDLPGLDAAPLAPHNSSPTCHFLNTRTERTGKQNS